MSAARVLLVDIETFPIVGSAWGRHEVNILSVERDWELASFAWKEFGRGRVQALARPDFKDKTDLSLVKAVRAVVDQADVLVGHNVDGFDSPKLRTKFLQCGMRPTSYRTIDTLKIARSQFRFSSNKLDDLGDALKVGHKLQTGGFDLWKRCMAGEAAAWRRMVRYNKQDVSLLERVYMELRAWYPQHVNLALYGGEGDRPECPVCESTRVTRQGYKIMVARRMARLKCERCGHWFSRPLSKVEKAG